MHSVQTAEHSIAYRPALDGVRAVGVLSVIAYHLGYLGGGFLGVDVFFVLSGYLITTLLLREHRVSGRIRLRQFWSRRARRLLPALLVLSAVVAIAIRTLRPVTEWPARVGDLYATILYFANWHQIATSQDYFAQWSGASPLRHMWSIAIEEQFYLLWPLLVALGLRLATRKPAQEPDETRIARSLLWPVAAAIYASLATTLLVFSPDNPTRAYVGTDTRAQELLVGAALALMLQAGFPARAHARWTGRLGLGSAAGVLVAMLLLSESSPLYYLGGALVFSSIVAVILWSVETMPQSALARGLATPPLPWIGRVSYGLYLWHWPAIYFTPTVLVVLLGGRGLQLADHQALLDGLAMLLAITGTVLSYYLVEQPIRHGRRALALPPARVAIGAAVAMTGALALVRTTLAVPQELLSQVQQVQTFCEQRLDFDQHLACVVVDSGPGRPVIAVMGDSVMRSLHPSFAAVAQRHRWTFVAAGRNRCTIVVRRLATGNNWEECMNAIPRIQEQVLSYKPTLIVISDNWLPIESFDDDGNMHPRNSPQHIADIEARVNALMPQLTSTGALVVLMRYTPESAEIACADMPTPMGEDCHVPAVNPRFAQYNDMLDRIAARDPERVRTIDLTDVVCPDGECPAKVDGLILRHDKLHYSAAGSQWLIPHLERKLIEAGIRLGL